MRRIRRRLFVPRRRVLFYVNSPMMAEHLWPYFEVLASDSRIFAARYDNFSLKSEAKTGRKRSAALLDIPKISLLSLWFRSWDLLIAADHVPDKISLIRPSLYVGHGNQGKVLEGHRTFYDYSFAMWYEGKPKYDAMAERLDFNRRLAIAVDPSISSIIHVVGDPSYDRLRAALQNRAEIRERFGFSQDHIVVVVLSTWGGDCLLQTIGSYLLQESVEIDPTIKLIFCIHPHEFRPTVQGRVGWGNRITPSPSVLVRNPDDSIEEYLASADLFVSDHTSVIQTAFQTGRPILTSPFPEEGVLEGSITSEIRRRGRQIDTSRGLSAQIFSALDEGNHALDELRTVAFAKAEFSADAVSHVMYDLLQLDRPE